MRVNEKRLRRQVRYLLWNRLREAAHEPDEPDVDDFDDEFGDDFGQELGGGMTDAEHMAALQGQWAEETGRTPFEELGAQDYADAKRAVGEDPAAQAAHMGITTDQWHQGRQEMDDWYEERHMLDQEAFSGGREIWEFGPEGYESREWNRASMEDLDLDLDAAPDEYLVALALSNRAEEILWYEDRKNARKIPYEPFLRVAAKIWQQIQDSDLDDHSKDVRSIISLIDAADETSGPAMFDQYVRDVMQNMSDVAVDFSRQGFE